VARANFPLCLIFPLSKKGLLGLFERDDKNMVTAEMFETRIFVQDLSIRHKLCLKLWKVK